MCFGVDSVSELRRTFIHPSNFAFSNEIFRQLKMFFFYAVNSRPLVRLLDSATTHTHTGHIRTHLRHYANDDEVAPPKMLSMSLCACRYIVTSLSSSSLSSLAAEPSLRKIGKAEENPKAYNACSSHSTVSVLLFVLYLCGTQQTQAHGSH